MARIWMVYYTRFGNVNVNTAPWTEVGSHTGKTLVRILGQCGVIPFSFRNQNFCSIHTKPVNRVLSSKKLWMFFVCKRKFSEKHIFFSQSFKTVIEGTNSGCHCLSRKCRTYTFKKISLHTRLIHFDWQREIVEMGGTCLREQKSIQAKVVFNSWKLYYYTEDTFNRNYVQRFSDIQRNEKVLP